MHKVPNHPVFKSYGLMVLPSGTYICPGWIKVPDGTTREDIEWETPLPKSSAPEWSEHFVKGTTGDYKVTISEQFGDRCTCPGYSFRKTCKHLEEIKRLKNEI